MGISATVKAKGTVQAVEAVRAGDTRRAGEVVLDLGVAAVKGTGKAEVLVGAVEEVEAVGARGAGEVIEVRDAVEAGDIARAEKVVRGCAAGAGKSNIVKASTAAILAAIQPMSLRYSNVCGSRRLGPSLVIAFLQSRLGSARSNISIL